MKKEQKIIEKKEHLMSDIKVNYDNIEYIYSNHSMIQLSSDDVQFVFGSIEFDSNGSPYKNLTHSMRISHEHFKRFVQSCNVQIENLKELEKQTK